MSVNVDIEVTNRCNADCYFCPRDQTPHEGLMTQAVFDQTLARACEYRDELRRRDPHGADVKISLTGLGEPLVNPRLAEWVRAVKDAGFTCVVSSNGALLDERRGGALLDAGLDEIWLNVGAVGEAYEDIYKLPWQRTHDNVVRFSQAAASTSCALSIVLVNYRQDPVYTRTLKEFWAERGIEAFVEYEIMNRGGSLFVDHMQFEALPQHAEARRLISERGRAWCVVPFIYVFVGYDGNYYLCCSDWRKEASFGSVFERAILDVTRGKLEHVASRGVVCRTCNLDPLNTLTDEMRAADALGSVGADHAAHADEMVAFTRSLEKGLEELVPGVTVDLPEEPRRRPSLPLINE